MTLLFKLKFEQLKSGIIDFFSTM